MYNFTRLVYNFKQAGVFFFTQQLVGSYVSQTVLWNFLNSGLTVYNKKKKKRKKKG